LRYELGERGDDVSKYGDLGFDDLVDVLGLNLEMNDTSSTF